MPDAAALRHSGSPNIDPYHGQETQSVQLGETGSLACKIYNVANRLGNHIQKKSTTGG